MKITAKGLLQAFVVVVVIVGSLRYARCVEEDAREGVRAAEADVARMRESRDSAFAVLRDSSTSWARERDSLDALSRDAQQRAALFRLRADSLFTLLGRIVPDSGRSIVETAREACDAQVDAYREAFGLCAQARISVEQELGRWRAAAESASDSLTVEEDRRLAAERRAAQASRRGIGCGPGVAATFRDYGPALACIYEAVRIRIPRLPFQ